MAQTDTLSLTPDSGRVAPRYKLDAAYTWVRVRRQGQRYFRLTGHAYDVSSSGMRFELDEALTPGQTVDVELMLPRSGTKRIRATGSIVRLHDPDEVGPIRMGLQFSEMRQDADRQRLERYLSQIQHLQNAA